MNTGRKHIEVAAAAIRDGDLILAAQRDGGVFDGMWEFPGGKLEKGETPRRALCREIEEELGADIIVDRLLTVVEHSYPDFDVTIHFFLCTLDSKSVTRLEHKALRWLGPDELTSVDWLPANAPVLQLLQKI